MSEEIKYIEEMLANANWSLIPDNMHESVKAYVLKGRHVGHFLSAIFAHEFYEAAGRADQQNIDCFHGWAVFLTNYIPGNCHGSPETVKEWQAHGGALGQPKLA